MYCKKTPLKYIWSPIKLVSTSPYYITKSMINRRFRRRTKYKIRSFFRKYLSAPHNRCDQNKSYMVFNKPNYHPGDTVKLKAYLYTTKGKPINENLTLYINNKKTATVLPYRKGAYTCDLVLHDSLQLKLDRTYNIALKGENIYCAKRIKYEDYELSFLNFNVRTSSKEHFKGTRFRLFIKATDENNLNISNATVHLTMKTKQVNKFIYNHSFVPDFLYRRDIILNLMAKHQ